MTCLGRDSLIPAWNHAWLADTLAGQESLVVVPTNESAARISGALCVELVALGKVDQTGVELRRDGNVADVLPTDHAPVVTHRAQGRIVTAACGPLVPGTTRSPLYSGPGEWWIAPRSRRRSLVVCAAQR